MNILNRNGDRVSLCRVPRWIEMRDVLPWGGHIVCVRNLVELFTCVNVRVLETIVFHYLKQDSVVHSAECAFKV